MAESGRTRKGIPAVLTILLAVLGITYLPRKTAESGNTTETPTQATSGTQAGIGGTGAAGESGPVSECQEIFDHIKRFYGGRDYYPNSCFPDAENPPKSAPSNPPEGLSFVIAIVPNPVETHLPLLFDRSISAIQQAAEDEGYTYDGSWFSWNDTPKGDNSPSDKEMAEALKEKRHRQPGVMVFRRASDEEPAQNQQQRRYYSSGGLIVFVVGEQPTGGIDDVQFEHAWQWLITLQPCFVERQVSVLGPTFTGSLPSLARELELQTQGSSKNARGSNTKQHAEDLNSIVVNSGSVTSDKAVDRFNQFLSWLKADRNMRGPVEFHTFSEGDTVITDRFLCYLLHDGYDLSRVAILSEDQTAFGHQSWDPETEGSKLKCGDQEVNDHRLFLYYPRDIATLRSAYEKQSIFSAGKQESNPNAPSTSLHANLSESPHNEHDAVRTYARQLTPLDQEAELFAIANVLDDKYIEFVIIRSSNTLDQLFLSEFLRRSYPNGRVVIDGSDLLLRKGMEGASLRGVLMLSTYPLMSWNRDAEPTFRAEQTGSYRVFAEDIVEGLYIAARNLFLPSGSQEVPISDYAPPRWAARATGDATRKEQFGDEKRPATWLSVVGHRQFWPVAVLNSNTEPRAPSTTSSILSPMDKAEEYVPNVPKRVQLPAEMAGLLAFCLILGLWHLYCCWKGSVIGFPRARASFAPMPRREHVILIHFGSLLIGLVGALLGLTIYNGFSVLAKYNYSIALATNSHSYSQALADGLRIFRSTSAQPVLTATLLLVIGYLDVVIGYFEALCGALKIFGSISALQAVLTVGLLLVIGYLACRMNCSLTVLSPAVSDLDSALSIDSYRKRALRWWPWSLLLLVLLYYAVLFSHVDASNRFAIFWRCIYLRSGVSGLLPQALLLFGLYAWFWFTLQGLSLFGADRPVLPKIADLPELDVPREDKRDKLRAPDYKIRAFRMLSQEEAGKPIEDAALPISLDYLKSLVVLLLITVLACYLALGDFGLRSLGDRRFGNLIFLGVCIGISVILADARQFLRTWSRLRQLLIFLDRLRLRRTFDALHGLSWDSVWKMSGNILEQRYRLLSLQFESMRSLTNLLNEWKPYSDEDDARKITLAQLNKCGDKGVRFVSWYVNLGQSSSASDLTSLKEFQEELAATTGCVMTQLILPAWNKEKGSLLIETKKTKDEKAENDKADTNHSNCTSKLTEAWLREAELFFILPYLGFIQNTIGRIRSIAMGVLALFVASTLAVSSYPFDPLPVIGVIFLITFLLIGTIVILVYAEMHRDATLSRITKTDPDKLGLEFWAKLFAFGIGPLIGLLTTLFPSMTDFVVSFLQPGAQAIK